MRLDFTKTALRQLEDVPAPVRRAFYKQAGLLRAKLDHPSLRTKKYSESQDVWQARVNRSWRFYFAIHGDTYVILSIISTQSRPKYDVTASRGLPQVSLHSIDAGPPPRFEPIPGTERVFKADLVLLAMGFTGPVKNGLLHQLGVVLDNRGNDKTGENYMTSITGIFVAGEGRPLHASQPGDSKAT